MGLELNFIGQGELDPLAALPPLPLHGEHDLDGATVGAALQNDGKGLLPRFAPEQVAELGDDAFRDVHVRAEGMPAIAADDSRVEAHGGSDAVIAGEAADIHKSRGVSIVADGAWGVVRHVSLDLVNSTNRDGNTPG